MYICIKYVQTYTYKHTIHIKCTQKFLYIHIYICIHAYKMYVCLFLFKLDSMIYEDRISAFPGHLFMSMVYYNVCSYYMVNIY